MSVKRLLAMFAVLALVAGCSNATGPKYPNPGEEENPLPGGDGNPTQGSLIVEPPVSWV